MSKYIRQLELPSLLQKKSIFLLGPRATGKSFLINQSLTSNALIINLLHSAFYLRLSARP